MAVVNRNTRLPYTEEVNADGVATQVELDNTISYHHDTFHNGEIKNIQVDGISYFWDGSQYLSKEYFMIGFCDNDTTTKNIYLYQKKNIRCSYSYPTLPFGKDMLIERIEVSLDAAKSGKLFDIETTTNNVIYTIDNPNVKYNYVLTNLVVPAGDPMRVYVKNITVRRPIVNLWIRLIHTP